MSKPTLLFIQERIALNPICYKFRKMEIYY